MVYIRVSGQYIYWMIYKIHFLCGCVLCIPITFMQKLHILIKNLPMRNRILAVALNWYGFTLLFSSVSLHIWRLNNIKVTIKCVLHLHCFNLLRLHIFIGMHIQKIKYHSFSWPYFKAFLRNSHHILHFETTIFIVCKSHLPLLGHPSSIKC